jgi:Rrf2 family nitric oxide-sensitive transcriptional repressor
MKSIINKETDYAIRLLIKLVQFNEPVNMNYLSKNLYINRPMLIKIIQILKAKNLIFTKKGKNGGIIINKKYIHINIYEILQKLGNEFDVSCCNSFGGKCCKLKSICMASKLFNECKTLIDDKLQQVQLKDLVYENIN